MYEEKVKAGAAWLDQVAPGWHNKADINKLDLGYSSACTLGQTLGALASKNLCTDSKFSVPRGFLVQSYIRSEKTWFGKTRHIYMTDGDLKTEYRKLSSAWIQEILRRRANDRIMAESANKVSTSKPEHNLGDSKRV